LKNEKRQDESTTSLKAFEPSTVAIGPSTDLCDYQASNSDDMDLLYGTEYKSGQNSGCMSLGTGITEANALYVLTGQDAYGVIAMYSDTDCGNILEIWDISHYPNPSQACLQLDDKGAFGSWGYWSVPPSKF
jgi:hypothetical protein